MEGRGREVAKRREEGGVSKRWGRGGCLRDEGWGKRRRESSCLMALTLTLLRVEEERLCDDEERLCNDEKDYATTKKDVYDFDENMLMTKRILRRRRRLLRCRQKIMPWTNQFYDND